MKALIDVTKALEDTRLSATDKAIYVYMMIRADETREYRMGISHLSQILQVHWSTANQAVSRLVSAGYVGPIHPGTRYVTWRMLDTPEPGQSPSPRVGEKKFSPQDAPRMAMPPDMASDILHYLIVQRRLLDAAITSDMQAITDDDRLRWQAESDRVDDNMDTLTRWMTRFGGGIPDDQRRE